MPSSLPHLPELLESYFGRATPGRLQALKADLSPRRCHRFPPAAGWPPLMVMQLPEDGAEGPSREQARAFIDVQRFLALRGLPVPQLYAVDLPHGLLLLEDLGDETFEARLRARPR